MLISLFVSNVFLTCVVLSRLQGTQPSIALGYETNLCLSAERWNGDDTGRS